MNPFDRNELIRELSNTSNWDVLIIGGGATGLGIAVDAATRGYKTILVEQSDFSKGTSSRSTKLLHGGVRYLAQGNIHLVREALKERGLILQNAPHISNSESFIIPCYSWLRSIIYAIGLKLYDWLSGKKSLGKSRWISRREVSQMLPGIEKKHLKCGVLYHDGTFDDARLAINLAQTAVEHGAVALNYFKATTLVKNSEGKICGAKILDVESGYTYDVNARVVINAAGVFADEILQMDRPGAKSMIRPSQGIHIVIDKNFLQSSNALMIPKTDDGRVLFAIPWYKNVLVGTTDTPLENHALEPRALDKEINFVLQNAGRYLSKKPSAQDVLSVFAGLRPLAASEGNAQKTKEISRSHKIVISDSRLVSVIGGKWTTYRKMAEDTLDEITRNNFLPKKTCVTMHLKVHGYALSAVETSLSYYGSDEKGIRKLMDDNPEWATTLAPATGISKAQVIWAVRNEMARTVEDVLARRTRILFFDAGAAIAAAPEVAMIMRKELGKDQAWQVTEEKKFIALAKQYLTKEAEARFSEIDK